MNSSINRFAKMLAVAGFLIIGLSMITNNVLPAMIGLAFLGVSLLLARE